ncbi:MAG: TIGR01841 family phasin [Aestuariivirga sp.]|uniref:phasin family protein n=1 Tax=Aestuariivirga sp. TaxID=2650926 RepID=UPI00301AB753
MSTKTAKPEMTNETVTKATEQVAEQVASFAQKTLDQAQGAFEKVSEVAHGNVQLMDAAANAYKNRVTDIQLKSMEFVQLNINSGFAFARKFFSVRDPSEVMNLQQSFLKEQAETLQRQASELSELSVALAKESLKPVQDQMSKSFATLSKVA